MRHKTLSILTTVLILSFNVIMASRDGIETERRSLVSTLSENIEKIAIGGH